MAVKLADGAQQGAGDGIVDLIDVGVTNAQGTLRFYTGAQNSDANTPATGAICDVDLANPACGATAATGIATFNGTPLSGTTSGAGTIQSCAVLDRDLGIIFTGSVTATGGGGDIELSSVAVGSGDTINITSLTLTVPQDQA